MPTQSGRHGTRKSCQHLAAVNKTRFAALAVVLLLISGANLSAAEVAVTPSPVQEDADLHDVRFIGSHVGWAVGDHGVVWHTEDGGDSWRLLAAPADCALRSVCFLTDRRGWIVGGYTQPFTRTGIGVVLASTDGGRTWTQLARERLPQLHYVRFFTPAEGVVVGEATAEFPTGVLVTHDGGKTWNPVEGDRHSGWRAADFVAPEQGITAGLDGAVARVDEKMLDARGGGFGTRGLYDVKLGGEGDGWAVGDGALVLHTLNRGVVWQAPPASLPEEAADIFNFHAVAVHGKHVWIAGSPGSVVWHSPDAGQTWARQPTGQAAPIARISFFSDEVGWAVGAFGSILRTDDCGATWRVQRAANRRAAILALPARPRDICFPLLAKEAGELGYRSVVLLPYRGDGEGAANLEPDLDTRLEDAVSATGASHGQIGWRFPIEIPDLDHNAERLIADWMRRTEGRFQPAFYGALVCQIRTWRPSVVLVDQPAVGDAAGALLANAVLDAVRQAADPASFPEQRELAALAPWKADRVFARLSRGSHGDFLIDADERLWRLKSTVNTVSLAGSSRLGSVDSNAREAETFRMVLPSRRRSPGEQSAAPGDFFAGLETPPGRDARRQLPDFTTEVDDAARRQAQRERNFRAMARLYAKDPTAGAEMIAIMRQSTRNSDRATAALQLAMLADVYRRNEQWELTEATLVELIDHYPNEAATYDAMQWLMHYWIGAEPTYQRLRKFSVERDKARFDPEAVGETIRRAVAQSQVDPKDRDPNESFTPPDPLRLTTHEEHPSVYSQGDLLELKLRQQHESALKMATLIRKRSPALFRSPEIQYPVASLLRQCGLRALPAEKSGRGMPLAEPPLMVDQKPPKTAKCLVVKQPPVLNGLLSDDCWQDADEITLSADSGSGAAGSAPHALLMLACDAQNLYFAISVPRHAGLPKDGAVTFGRKHDQDLSPFDRVALYFDIDRDCYTWYSVEVDQRGCIAESCWGDPNWNPRMGVAVDAGEPDRWRIEGAIPFSELVPRPPKPGETWGLAVIRTLPAVGLESWSPPAARHPRPESFGLIRFQ